MESRFDDLPMESPFLAFMNRQPLGDQLDEIRGQLAFLEVPGL